MHDGDWSLHRPRPLTAIVKNVKLLTGLDLELDRPSLVGYCAVRMNVQTFWSKDNKCQYHTFSGVNPDILDGMMKTKYFCTGPD